MKQTTKRASGLTLAAAVLVACSGGGGDGTATGGVAGIDRTGGSEPVGAVAFGTVTAFGSIVVNGVRYETASAEFTIDDAPGGQDDLAVGDVVLVRGSLDDGSMTDGVAETVVFDDNVEGPVQRIDRAAGTLTVLGQLVHVTADTSFDDSLSPATLDGISPGDVVEVSGLVASDGSIDATRIEPKAAGGELELTGVVEAHDSAAQTFAINDQPVDYSAAMLEDFSSGAPADGDLVEVHGELDEADTLVAARVEREDRLGTAEAGERAEIEGFVTRFASATDFDVGGFPVTTTGTTQIEGGLALDDLGLDVKVEVEGSVDDAGVLVATKIDIRRSSAVRALARVDSVDAAAGSFVVLGIPVDVDALTRIEDKSDADVEPFGVADLAAGDFVELRGAEQPPGSGRILASLVEREDPDAETELQGFVTGVTEPSFEILGVTVETVPGTVFRDANEAPIGADAFFADLGEGALVKAIGTETSARTITADEVELEIE